MATPYLPFVTGAVVGSLATFLYMDKGSQDKIRSGAASVAGKVSDGALRAKEAIEPEAAAKPKSRARAKA